MKAIDIVRRFEALKNERAAIEGMWRYMEQFVMPYRVDLYESHGDENSVDWRKRDIYDSTAPDSADGLASSLQGSLISASVRWFDLRFKQEKLNEDDDAMEWLQECCDVIYSELQTSTFNSAAAESLLDLVSMGTMALIEEASDEDASLEFTAVPVSDCYFEIGSKNQVLRFYRKLKWTALQCADKFGEENLPKIIRDVLEKEAGVSQKFDIVFCVYKRTGPGIVKDVSQPAAKRARPFGYKYVLTSSREELGDEGGYYEMPAFVTRWRTAAGSIWGYGPGFKMLSTIMDVNEFVEISLEKGAQDIEPPLMSTQRGIISDLDRRRGGITIVSDPEDIQELPGRGEAQLNEMNIDDMRQMIRRAFFVDQLELKESPAMTATEVTVRYELMQRLMGPTMGRLKTDWLDPMITRTFNICYRLGKLPSAPQVVKDSRAELDVEYIGPLPRAQKAETARNTASWLGIVGNLAEIRPDSLDVPDWDAALRGIGDDMGVPAKYMKGEKELKEVREARAAEQKKLQKIEEARMMGEAGQSIGAASQALPPEAIAALQQGVMNG